jgi:hypothetical protein
VFLPAIGVLVVPVGVGRETVPGDFLGKYWADGGERGHFWTRLAMENLKSMRSSWFRGLGFEL